jgi:8-oxo-dGTP pyrophosphatase MutT (NUDIX family)
VLPEIRERLKKYSPRTLESPKSICAGVIVPLFQKDEELFVLLTKRSEEVGVHKGEVSFPGGMCEDKDGNTLNTALRECCEEIGVKQQDVEVIGKLDDMVTLTGFVIAPYVGIIPHPYGFRTNPGEVAYLINLPMAHLMDAILLQEQATYNGKTWTVPTIYYQGDRIWGATCKILLQLCHIVRNETV